MDRDDLNLEDQLGFYAEGCESIQAAKRIVSGVRAEMERVMRQTEGPPAPA